MIILKKNNSLVSNNNNSQKLEQDEFHTLTITFSMQLCVQKKNKLLFMYFRLDFCQLKYWKLIKNK